MPRTLGFAITLAAAGCAYAQLSRGYISGTVEDPSGARAPSVSVTITNQATGVLRTTATNEAGVYRVVAVEPGVYAVEFSKLGFQTFRAEGIEVRSAQEAPLNHTLVLTQAATSVLVEATPPGVSLAKASASIERTLGQGALESLPLTGFRDTTNLMAIAPTAVRVRTFGESNSNYTAAGQRIPALGFLADGADNKLYMQGFQNWRPIPEGISEMQVQTNAYSAEFGRSAGVLVSVISRAGTNQLHGSLWDYYGANWLSARAVADKQAGLSKPRFQQHQVGVNLGGPLVKDKTFFFFLVQSAPERVGLSARTVPQITIPTPAGYAVLSRVPLAPGQTAENRRAVLDTLNFLPSIYPQVARFENVRPLSINEVPVEIGTTRIPAPNSIMTWTSQGRLDHRFGEKDSVTLRYQSERGAGDLAFRAAAVFSNFSFGPLFASNFAHWDSTLQATHTRVFTPRVISEFRFSSGWGGSLNNSVEPAGATVSVPGFGSGIGAYLASPIRHSSKQFQWQEVLTFQRGRHSLKVGADVARHLEHLFHANLSRGTWTFNSLQDLVNNSAFVFAQLFSPLDVNYTQTQQSYFFQDDFKISRHLTFSLGVRYQTAGQPYAQFGATAPDLLAAGALPPARRDTNDWAPRLGFAWSPAAINAFMGRLLGNGTTVFRGGYGVAYVQLYGPAVTEVASNYPLNSAFVKAFPETLNLYPTIPAKPASIPPLIPRMEAFTHLLPDMQNPTTHFYSFSVQRQIGLSYFLEAGYMGNRAYHLERRGQRNPAILTPQQAQTVIDAGNALGIPNVPDRRLNPAWGSRQSMEYAAISNYNGGFIRFDRKISRGLLVGANYTFSAALDDGDRGESFPQNALNFHPEYGRAAIDRPHRLAVHYVWNLPGFDGGASVWERFLGGWQIAGFSEWQSGQPFTVTTGVDSNGDGNPPLPLPPSTDRPDYNPGGVLRLDPVTGDWRTFTTPLDGTGVFRTPLTRAGAPLQNSMPFGGNLGRNTYRGPRYTSTNVSLLKTFAVSERWKAELRASWTNFLNQRNFGPPVSAMNSPQFGTNTSSPDSRTTLLGLKIRF